MVTSKINDDDDDDAESDGGRRDWTDRLMSSSTTSPVDANVLHVVRKVLTLLTSSCPLSSLSAATSRPSVPYLMTRTCRSDNFTNFDEKNYRKSRWKKRFDGNFTTSYNTSSHAWQFSSQLCLLGWHCGMPN